MDPLPIGPGEWSQLGAMLTTMWLVVLFVVLFAGSMLVGHNLIPSFVQSQHIPSVWQKARPIFYALAILFFAVAMFLLYRVIGLAGVLREFWPNYWI